MTMHFQNGESENRTSGAECEKDFEKNRQEREGTNIATFELSSYPAPKFCAPSKVG